MVLAVIKNGSEIALPAPVTISAGEEIIWSSNTGRGSTGKMLGDVIAQKQSLSITWGILTATEYKLIKTSLVAGFFSLKINIDGTPETLARYRGTLTGEALGQLGDGIYYFRSATCNIIEQ